MDYITLRLLNIVINCNIVFYYFKKLIYFFRKKEPEASNRNVYCKAIGYFIGVRSVHAFTLHNSVMIFNF